jgi:hypothetical protein
MVTDYRTRQSLFVDTICVYLTDIDTNRIHWTARILLSPLYIYIQNKYNDTIKKFNE